MLAQELDLDREHFLFDKLEKELQFQNQVVSISQRGDPFNELKMKEANDTFGDQILIPSTRKTQEKQRMIAKNFNLRNLQQICGSESIKWRL